MNAIDSMMDFQASALRLRGERQRVIASNIANADTPGYKARDFDFGKALAEATGTATAAPTATATDAGPSVAATQPGHFGTTGNPASTTSLAYRQPYQASLDGNSVEIDVERAKFAENTIRYEAALRFLGGNIKSLQAAITGQ